jgi:hypothetical protein
LNSESCAIRYTITRVEVRSRKLFLRFITQWFTRNGATLKDTLTTTKQRPRQNVQHHAARFQTPSTVRNIIGNEFSWRYKVRHITFTNASLHRKRIVVTINHLTSAWSKPMAKNASFTEKA